MTKTIVQLNESERICATDRFIEIERRCEDDDGDTEWRGFEIHGNLTEAVSAAAYRDIHTLPNEDLDEWQEASEKVLGRYQSILSRALESWQEQTRRLERT